MTYTNGRLEDTAQNYNNFQYLDLDGTNDRVRTTWNGTYDNLTSFDWSIRVWVRMDQTSAANRNLWDFNAQYAGATSNRVFLQYNQQFNRMIARVRTNSSNFGAQWALHDNNSATGTGTSSSNTWLSSNRGNVNSDNMCMITMTYDASQSTGSNACKLYWNASQFTSTAVSNNGSRTNNAMPNLMLGGQNNSTNGSWNGLMDEWAFYNKVLTSTEISNLYASGARAKAAQQVSTTNLIENCSFDLGGTNNVTLFSNKITSVTFQNGANTAPY